MLLTLAHFAELADIHFLWLLGSQLSIISNDTSGLNWLDAKSVEDVDRLFQNLILSFYWGTSLSQMSFTSKLDKRDWCWPIYSFNFVFFSFILLFFLTIITNRRINRFIFSQLKEKKPSPSSSLCLRMSITVILF